MNVIDTDEDEVVGLVRDDRDFDGDFIAASAVDPKYLIDFAERCQSMGWDLIDLYVIDDGSDYPIMAHERRDDQGVYVALCPVTPDKEDE